MSLMSPPRCSCGTPMIHEYPNGSPKCPHCDNPCPSPGSECPTCRALGRADLHNQSTPKLPKPMPGEKWWNT